MPTFRNDEEPEAGEELTPLDSIIQRVESYIENPRLATPETLTELRDELLDLKSVTDSEEEPEGGMMEKPESKRKGLSIIIGEKQ